MKKFSKAMLKAYFICGTQDLPFGQTLTEIVEEALKAGITAYQFRDKGPHSTLTAAQRPVVAQKLRQMCTTYHVPFIVDDDVELAQKVQADGIHIGQSDESAKHVLTDVKDSMFVGLSCSNEKEILAAEQLPGIAYYGSGPVYTTDSKADASPVIGITGLKRLNKLTTRPIVAIGGITEETVSAVAQTGVAGSAVISMIAQSTDIKKTVAKMLAV